MTSVSLRPQEAKTPAVLADVAGVASGLETAHSDLTTDWAAEALPYSETLAALVVDHDCPACGSDDTGGDSTSFFCNACGLTEFAPDDTPNTADERAIKGDL